MAIQKPSKPEVILPDNFGGIKTPYSDAQISNGYQEAVPQVVDGGNINYEKDAVFKYLKYLKTAIDALVDMPIGKFLTVDSNNKFEYVDKPEVSLSLYQLISNLSQTIDASTTKYPSNKAVQDEVNRITNIMQNKASGYPNWAGISKPVNAVFTVDAPGLLFIESTRNNATGYVTINNFQMIYGSGNGFATDYYCVTYLVDRGDVVQTTDATARAILFMFKTKV